MSNLTLIQWYTNLNKSIFKILSSSTHKNAKNYNLNKLIIKRKNGGEHIR